MIFLETPRLMLRTVAPEDAAAIHGWRNDPRCVRYQRGQVRSTEKSPLWWRSTGTTFSLWTPLLWP